MSSKIMVAAAIMAAGSFLFIDTADAQRRGGGAERDGNINADAGGRRDGARQNRRGRRGARVDGRRRTADRPRNTRRIAGETRNPRGTARPRNNRRRNAQNNDIRTPRAMRPPRHIERRPRRPGPRFTERWDRGLYDDVRPRWRDRFRFRNTWRRLPWVGGGYGGRSCTAVARTDGGDGRALRGVFGDGYGRRACRKALNECNLRLDYRQAQGRNPYARCVIASR